MADNWIYGTGSDPWKVAAMRAATRSRSAYLALNYSARRELHAQHSPQQHQQQYLPQQREQQEEQENQQMLNFSRQLLKGGEHTWGTDTQYGRTNLPNDVWSNVDLARARQNHSHPSPLFADSDVAGTTVARGDSDEVTDCPGLHGNTRPEPPCPKYWWQANSVSCAQGCPSGAQKRDPTTGVKAGP
jgi:hypothetical protein